jgi:hypothetical protein
MTCGHLLDDRTEIAVRFLETLVFRDEALKMMEKHPVENRAFRMTRAVDSRHIRESRSKMLQGDKKEEVRGWPEKHSNSGIKTIKN